MQPRMFHRFTTRALEDCLLPRPTEHPPFGWPSSDGARLHDDLLEYRHFAATK